MHTELVESAMTLSAADGVSIPAVFTRPAGDTKHGVVMLHGITTHKNEFGDFYTDLAQALAAEGVSSIRIDFRGHGDSREDSRSFSIPSQILDTIAASRWMLKATEFDRVHLIGTSFGAPPGIFLARQHPSIVGTLNLICPVLDYEKTFLVPSTEWAKEIFSEATISEAFERGMLVMPEGFSIDVKLLLEMSLIRPYEALSEIQTPTLVIHGEADSMVPYRISKEYTSDQPHVTLIGIPRMEHGFNDEDDETGQSSASRCNFRTIVTAIADNIRRSR